MPEDFRGKTVKCTKCGKKFAVKSPAEQDFKARIANVPAPLPPAQSVSSSDQSRRGFPYVAVGLPIAAIVVVGAVVSVVALRGRSSGSEQPPAAEAPAADARLQELQTENARLKTQLAQLEATARRVPELEAENARLKSQPAPVENSAEQSAAPEPPARSRRVLPRRQPRDQVVQTWGLEDAVLEVKVLKIVQSSSYAKMFIHVTNRSKAFLAFWNVGASIHSRKNTFLASNDTNGQNLRPGDSIDGDLLFSDVNASQIARWTLRLGRITVQSESGEKLFQADKYFTLKEVKDGPVESPGNPSE
jgi:hypothetical protein